MGKYARCSKDIDTYRFELLYPMIEKEIAWLTCETDRLWDVYLKTRSEDNPAGDNRAFMDYDRSWQREKEVRKIFTDIQCINGITRTSIGDFIL